MNVKRFIGRNSREAMQKVKAAFGDDAVVLSTKPAAEGGIEILAMAGESVPAIDSYVSNAPAAARPASVSLPTASRKAADAPAAAPTRSAMANLASSVQDDVKQLAMSTLSFQDYVRERMLKRRQAAMQSRAEPALVDNAEAQLNQRFAAPKAAPVPEHTAAVDLGADLVHRPATLDDEAPDDWQSYQAEKAAAAAAISRASAPARAAARPAAAAHADLTMAQMVPAAAPAARRDEPRASAVDTATVEALKAAQDANAFMMGELRAMRAMMKERFDTMAFVEKLGRTPAQAALAQKLLDGGFSAVLIRKMLDAMPAEVIDGTHDEVQWATQVLQRNLNTADRERAIEDQGGVFALIGSTGVGKTTSTAKLAATFAAKHGASNLGLITLDAYRVGAHEQLRAYGRILGVPVHMAHDRAALEDLLELLSGKKMILIDTAGMAQRDGRTKELLDLLAHPSIKKLLVINTAAQGDAIEDVMHAYQAHACAGVILSKLDEAVKLGPALDALIRHKLKVVGVANGQRVPEDWHRLSAQALVHRALRASLNPAYRLDPTEVSLVFSTPSPTEAQTSARAM
ncbi:MAG: flagellar biosynthesis protein FlhF [Burkholderiales bacterium RIFCSPLOWO2_12_FULL_64_99]|nr:MAG: flagellar biosynthesis protein FlhF [Burkholderiales bacterium RIFCSPHIGHO2_12_FULL_63_20]OGB66669.1 MAG: flagellar biosynthesis protein FlhF [Burkholderiales bacterium RIFCSPLOWO2_12_FULL_64_99]